MMLSLTAVLVVELPVALAAAYGGLAALVGSGLLVWRWHRGLRVYHCDGGRHLKDFGRSSVERFFVVGVLLAAGMASGKLEPLALLVGFAGGQALWVLLIAGMQRN